MHLYDIMWLLWLQMKANMPGLNTDKLVSILSDMSMEPQTPEIDSGKFDFCCCCYYTVESRD